LIFQFFTNNFFDNFGADFTDKNNIKLVGESKRGVILKGDKSYSGIFNNKHVWCNSF